MKTATVLLVLLITFPLVAQMPAGAEKNAALRYWNAFSSMSDLSLSDGDSKRLEAIANGSAAWDEGAFGKLVDANSSAVEIMVRGTALPYCAWGVEYDQGAAASIPQISRGRALARLNVLTAQRLAARGDSHAATLHLIAGIHFARDLSQGMPLIGVLTGKLALLSTLNTAAALAPRLAPSDRLALARSMRALPPDVFDWSRALHQESVGIRDLLMRLKSSPDPKKWLTEWGEDPNKFGDNPRPSDADLRQYDAVMSEAVRVFHQPAGQVRAEALTLDARIKKLGPAVSAFTPSLQRTADNRQQVQDARSAFLHKIDALNAQ